MCSLPRYLGTQSQLALLINRGVCGRTLCERSDSMGGKFPLAVMYLFVHSLSSTPAQAGRKRGFLPSCIENPCMPRGQLYPWIIYCANSKGFNRQPLFASSLVNLKSKAGLCDADQNSACPKCQVQMLVQRSEGSGGANRHSEGHV